MKLQRELAGTQVPQLQCSGVISAAYTNFSQGDDGIDGGIMRLTLPPCWLVGVEVAQLKTSIAASTEHASTCGCETQRTAGILVRSRRRRFDRGAIFKRVELNMTRYKSNADELLGRVEIYRKWLVTFTDDRVIHLGHRGQAMLTHPWYKVVQVLTSSSVE